MTDDDNFLARWSRRKSDAAADALERRAKDGGAVASEVPGDCVPSGKTTSSFDPGNLPPIESIGPGSDVRDFLAAGVPADVTRAALRRLWSSDPNIRDFVGLSENSWDFNAPGAMAGFGPIDEEQAGRVLTQLLGDPNSEAVPRLEAEIGRLESVPREPPASIAAIDQKVPDTAATTKNVTQHTEAEPVSQHASSAAQHRAPRRMGSALPE